MSNQKRHLFLQIVLFTHFMISSFIGFSQKSNAIWESKRNVFNTLILKDGIVQSRNNILSSYREEQSFKSISLYKKSRIFLPASPVFILGGTYLGYDAIKGTKRVIEADGQFYTYYIRPIKQLIGGIGVFAVGVCLLEYSNEFKSKSVDLFNQRSKINPKKNEFDINLGFTPSGGIGISAKF